MTWSHKARLHWVCNDVAGISGEVRVIDGVSYWDTVDMETGEILASGTMGHPLDAMHYLGDYFRAVLEVRNAFQG